MDIEKEIKEIKEIMYGNTEKILNNMDRLHSHEEKINNNSEKIEKNTGALDLLHTINSNSNKYFIIWMITFIVFFITQTVSILYIFKLKSDANTIVTTTTEEIEQDTDDGDNYYIGRDGDINGKAKDKENNNNKEDNKQE